MTQTSFAQLTATGRAKEAAALANGTSIQITHIVIGDGQTVPSGGEVQLYNEIARKTITGHGTVTGATNVAYFDAYLAAADGPFTIRETGLIDSDGDLIAIVHYNPPLNKPSPASGQAVEATLRIEVAFSDIAHITIAIDPAMQVALQRLSRLPWISAISMITTAPPAAPVPGDTYLIPAGATGAWAAQEGKIAEYTTAGWAIIQPTDGHGIGLPDGRLFVRNDGSYAEYMSARIMHAMTKVSGNHIGASLASRVVTVFGPSAFADDGQADFEIDGNDIRCLRDGRYLVSGHFSGNRPDGALAAMSYGSRRNGVEWMYASIRIQTTILYTTLGGAAEIMDLAAGDVFQFSAYADKGSAGEVTAVNFHGVMSFLRLTA